MPDPTDLTKLRESVHRVEGFYVTGLSKEVFDELCDRAEKAEYALGKVREVLAYTAPEAVAWKLTDLFAGLSELAEPLVGEPESVSAKDFEAYGVGLTHASVCTSLGLGETTARLNREHPTGIESTWHWAAADEFKGGEPNPSPCPDHPETHKHYLFVC